MMSLVPLGDSAFLARFASDEEAVRWAEAVRIRHDPWIVDVVAAYSQVAVFVDPEKSDHEPIDAALSRIEPISMATTIRRTHQIPVVYDGADIDEIAERLGLTVAQVTVAHSVPFYRVAAIGFLPGFPYAGVLPEALRGLPRRTSPRPRVLSGSVAIVGKQTAIYPAESPGGWHLIGRTPLKIVDVASGAFPILVGDQLQFIPIAPQAFESHRGLLK